MTRKYGTVDGQLDLLELLRPPRPTGPFTCEWCGAVSGTLFVHELNHGLMRQAMCMSMFLTRNHALWAIRNLNPDERSGRGQCFHHPTRRKPCPQECFETHAAEEAEVAIKVWGSDAWKTYDDALTL